MALIPPDAAIRLRMQTDTSLSPVAPLKALSADLPDLQAGQRFIARIQQPLPENTYRALVGGKEITLSLPETVKSGDTLELVVVERSSRMVLAQLAHPLADSLPNPSNPVSADSQENLQATQISPAGQLIGKLLAPAGQAPEPVVLNRGEPLVTSPLPQVDTLAAILVPKLAEAATQSGLFYEAHQALWLSGQHSMEALKEEPQAHHAILQKTKAQMVAEAVQHEFDNTIPDQKDIATDPTAPSTPTGMVGDTGTKDLMQSIPAELRPLVQQQLDAAATQRLTWHGEVWPGQTIEWQISRDAPGKSSAEPNDTGQWNTSLTMTTPKLGRIEAKLGISGNRVHINLAADSTVSMSKLSQRLPALATALEASGLNPAGLQVVKNDNR